MNIVLHPDPLLNQISKDVETFDAALVSYCTELVSFMQTSKGIGIAAVQVGDLKRILVCVSNSQPLVMINPVVLGNSYYTQKPLVEGCLSIPGQNVSKVRVGWVRVSYSDVLGNVHEKKLKGFEGIVFMHELDHLNGVTLLGGE